MLNVAVFVLLVAVFTQLIQDKVKLPASMSTVVVGLMMKYAGFAGGLSLAMGRIIAPRRDCLGITKKRQRDEFVLG